MSLGFVDPAQWFQLIIIAIYWKTAKNMNVGNVKNTKNFRSIKGMFFVVKMNIEMDSKTELPAIFYAAKFQDYKTYFLLDSKT